MLTRQLFSYDSLINRWTDLTQSAANANIPPCAYHTATLVDDRWMVILGGAVDDNAISGGLDPSIGSANSTFKKRDLSTAYVFDLVSNTWRIQPTTNYSNLSRIGHSADYIPRLGAIVVVGGTDRHFSEVIYEDVLLLDISTWTWSDVNFRQSDGRLTKFSQSWHASYLLEDQLFLTFDDKSNSQLDFDYRVVNVNNWTYTDQVKAAPLSSRLKVEALTSGPQSPMWLLPPNPPPSEAVGHNTRFILGSTLGAIGGASLALLLVLLYRRFSKWQAPSSGIEPDSNVEMMPPSFPFLLNPVWANSGPNVNNDTSNLWDMDSQYAYSTHMTSTPDLLNHHHLLIPIKNQPIHSQDTLLCSRRWSAEMEKRSPKHFAEVPPSFCSNELFKRSSLRMSWSQRSLFNRKKSNSEQRVSLLSDATVEGGTVESSYQCDSNTSTLYDIPTSPQN